MISTNMDSLLNANLDGSSATFSMFAGYMTPDPTTHDTYFFLRRELDVTDMNKYKKAYSEGKIRHCKPYRGGWFDYIVRKEFTTLEEWIKDAGDTMENVLYGVNRVYRQDWQKTREAGKYVGQAPKYVTLETILEYYGYVKPPPAVNSFTDIANELNMKITNEGGKCLVKKSDGVIVVGKIIDIKQSKFSNTPTQVCILVPKTTNSGSFIAYESMSDLPRGTTIYFRTDDGFFHSIEELMKE